MTREEITRIAREVGFDDGEIETCQLMFENFAFLVASAEREDIIELASDLYYWDHSEELIKAIRARGQA